jgi:hypothetical protein
MATLQDETTQKTKSIQVGLAMTMLAKVRMSLVDNMMSTC